MSCSPEKRAYVEGRVYKNEILLTVAVISAALLFTMGVLWITYDFLWSLPPPAELLPYDLSHSGSIPASALVPKPQGISISALPHNLPPSFPSTLSTLALSIPHHYSYSVFLSVGPVPPSFYCILWPGSFIFVFPISVLHSLYLSPSLSVFHLPSLFQKWKVLYLQWVQIHTGTLSLSILRLRFLPSYIWEGNIVLYSTVLIRWLRFTDSDFTFNINDCEKLFKSDWLISFILYFFLSIIHDRHQGCYMFALVYVCKYTDQPQH